MRADLIVGGVATCRSCGAMPDVTRVTLPYGRCWHIDCVNPECPDKPGTWYYYRLIDARDEWNEMQKGCE